MRFAVLFYMNRSGSTYLSRIIADKSSNVCVLPEVAFLLQILRKSSKDSFISGDQLYETIKNDPRSQALGITDEDIRRIASTNSSLNIPKLIADIATTKHGFAPELVVFKLNQLLWFERELREAFQDLIVIHIFRDPRAVASSMLSTPVPEKQGFNMARGSVLSAALEWKRYIRKISSLKRDGTRVVEVRFEDLQTTADSTIANIRDDAGIPAINIEAPQQTYLLAGIDHALHPNIYREFQAQHVDNWKVKLSPSAIAAIERSCWDEMEMLGYQAVHKNKPLGIRVFPFELLSAFQTLKHYFRTLIFHLRNGENLTSIASRLSHGLRFLYGRGEH